MLTVLGILTVAGVAWYSSGKIAGWWNEKSERKMLQAVMRAEIEEDVERRRPTQQEIWDAERELDEDLSDIVSK